MEKLLEQLKKTSATNEKLGLLKSYSDNTKVLEALKLTYDPMMQFYVKKIDLPECSGTLDFVNSFDDFYSLASILHKRQATGNHARRLIEEFMCKCNKDVQNLYTLILKKDLKVGISVKTLQKAFGEDFIFKFTVQLANPYLKDKKYKTKEWFASPKLDGIRGYTDSESIKTRNGHPVIGFDHIFEEVGLLKKEINEKTGFHISFADGELYTDKIKFQKIQGAVTSNKNIDPARKSLIKYYIFAVVSDDFVDTYDMIEALNSVDWTKYKYLIQVPYKLIKNDYDEIKAACEEFMEQGFEGVVLRNPLIPYEYRRSDALVKFKLFREWDFPVVDFLPGNKGTKYEYTLGGFVIRGSVETEEGNNNWINVTSEVGSGFDDEDRDDIWNNKDFYRNKMAEIKFQGITDDLISLRFAVFNKFKMDR
jgi:DNA ligase-1